MSAVLSPRAAFWSVSMPRDAQIRLEQARGTGRAAAKGRRSGDRCASDRPKRGSASGTARSFNIETFSQVKSIKANLELAEKELTRAERLFDTGDISKSISISADRSVTLCSDSLTKPVRTRPLRSRRSILPRPLWQRPGQAVSTARTQVDQAQESHCAIRRSMPRSADMFRNVSQMSANIFRRALRIRRSRRSFAQSTCD